jgi:farnesol dehydrogenase
MKYFITGVSGFIGSNLAHELVTDGHTVHANIRDNRILNKFIHHDVKLFKGGLENKEVLIKAMEGCETAFHLAALAKPWSKDPHEFHRINVEGAVNVFTAAREAGVRKVVFTSSAATMSPSNGRDPATEATPRRVPFFNDYEVTKSEAEARAREFSDNGMPVVIVNPTRVYGPGPMNASNSVTRMIAGYLKGTWRIIPGDGKKIGNYVFIDDVVHGHLLAAQKGKPGERYILGGENITFDELFRILGEVTGIRRRMIHLPLALMTTTAKFMEWQYPLTRIPPAITASWVRKYLNDWSLSSNKAVADLGYRITPFADGVKKTVEWLKYINAR